MTGAMRGTLLLMLAAAGATPGPAQEPRQDLYGDALPPGVLARLGTSRLRQVGHPGAVAFTADGKRLAAWGSNGLTLIDPGTGKTLHEAAMWSVLAARLSADGREVTAVTVQTSVTVVWRLSPEPTKVFTSFENWNVTAAAVAADGRTVTLGLADGSVRILDSATGRLVRTLTGPTDSPAGLGYSPDGTTLARAGQKSVGLWELATGRETRLLEIERDGGTFCAAFSPDGKTLVTGEYSGKVPVRVWDVATAKERYSVRDMPFGSFPRAVAFTPEGKAFAHTGEGGVVFLRDVATGNEVRRFLTGGNTYAAAFSPDGKTLAASVSQYPAGTEVKLFEVATGRELFDFPRHQLGVESVLMSADGKTAVTAGIDRTVRVWDAATGRPRFTVGRRDIKDIRQRGWPITLTPDGRTLLVASGAEIGVWDLATGRELRRLRGPESEVVALAISPAGKKVAAVSVETKARLATDVIIHDHAAHVLDLDTGKVGLALPGLSPAVTQVKFAAGETLLALGAPEHSYRGGVTLYTTTGRASFTFARPGGVNDPTMHCFDISPDGKLLAVVTDKVRFWDAATGDEKKAFVSPAGPWFSALAFSPSGRYMAGSRRHEGWCVFEAASGRVVWEQKGRPAGHHGIAFSPDGGQLLTGCEDGTALIWELPAVVAQP